MQWAEHQERSRCAGKGAQGNPNMCKSKALHHDSKFGISQPTCPMNSVLSPLKYGIT